MIDFRYHIVSLISVFLALAVGIALGAGPLKETIGDTLTGQVEQLRSEKDALRSELDRTADDLGHAASYIDAAGPQLLEGALADRRVAVVSLGEVGESVRNGIDDRLAQSGATVTAHVTLTESWTDPDLDSFRQALGGQLVGYLNPAVPDDAGVQDELAAALVQGLVAADPAAPDALASDSAFLLELLSGGDYPLVTIQDTVETAADAVVVVAPTERATGDAASADPDQAEETAAAWIAVLSAAQERSQGAVLADGPPGSDSLTSVVLGDDALADALTTVSGTQVVTGQVSTPLALAARIAGNNGHYGFGEGETVLPEAVSLPPVDRTPTADAGAPAGDGGTEGTQG